MSIIELWFTIKSWIGIIGLGLVGIIFIIFIILYLIIYIKSK